MAEVTPHEFRKAVKLFVKDSPERLAELADEFEAAPGTVSRWAHGHSMPVVRMRRLVLDYIKARSETIPDASP